MAASSHKTANPKNRAPQHTYNTVFIGYLYVKQYLLEFQRSYMQLKIVKRKHRLQIVENLTADEQYRA
jgi:hypothetical protein